MFTRLRRKPYLKIENLSRACSFQIKVFLISQNNTEKKNIQIFMDSAQSQVDQLGLTDRGICRVIVTDHVGEPTKPLALLM